MKKQLLFLIVLSLAICTGCTEYKRNREMQRILDEMQNGGSHIFTYHEYGNLITTIHELEGDIGRVSDLKVQCGTEEYTLWGCTPADDYDYQLNGDRYTLFIKTDCSIPGRFEILKRWSPDQDKYNQ